MRLSAEGVYCIGGFVLISLSPRDNSPDLYRSRNGRAEFDQDGDPIVVDEPDDEPPSEGVRSLDDFLRSVRELWFFGRTGVSKRLPNRESLDAIERRPISLLNDSADILALARCSSLPLFVVWGRESLGVEGVKLGDALK